jgi:hypothetical protein
LAKLLKISSPKGKNILKLYLRDDGGAELSLSVSEAVSVIVCVSAVSALSPVLACPSLAEQETADASRSRERSAESMRFGLILGMGVNPPFGLIDHDFLCSVIFR